MKIVYILVAVLSMPATLVLSNLFWFALREARSVSTLLSSPDMLRSIVNADFLNSPPTSIARFAQPVEAGYAFNMEAFQQSHNEAHIRGRSLLRLGLAVVIVGSGVVGFLAVGWFGLALPIINFLILHTTFVGSMHGTGDNATTGRAIEHVQVVSLILHRWYAKSPQQLAAWLESEPRMKPLGNLITSFPPQ